MTARRTLATAVTAAALGSILAGGAAAQTPSRERTAAYAEAVALAPASTDQYARWDDDICPRVAGLPGAEAQALIDRVARRAHEVGLNTGSAGCTPNLIVIFAPNAATVAREIVDTRRDLLGYYNERNTSNAGRDALDAFVNSQHAVRWWHVARTVGADGEEMGTGQAERGSAGAESAAMNQAGMSNVGAALSVGSFEGVDTVRSSGARTRRNTRQDIRFALIVIEAPRVAGASAQAVADYVAMAALAQLNPDSDMSAYPSILNLFNSASQPAPTAMTQWDSAFLRGLYRTRRDAAARQQRTDIARRMADQIAAN
ncbi:MAG: hypothetical protein ACREH4_16690 [Vitreimonas sp.]